MSLVGFIEGRLFEEKIPRDTESGGVKQVCTKYGVCVFASGKALQLLKVQFNCNLEYSSKHGIPGILRINHNIQYGVELLNENVRTFLKNV